MRCGSAFIKVSGLVALLAGCGGESTPSSPPAGNAPGSPIQGPNGSTTAALCASTEIATTPLRRLTRFEYRNTVRDLLGVDPSPANDLPVDEVTDGFNNNAAVLTVSALHAEKYVLVAEALAKAAVSQNLPALTGCDPAAKDEAACATAFAKQLGRRAFRRATTAQDEQQLMAAYQAGREGGTHAEGIEVMIRAALQSVHFLYRLETTTPANAQGKLVPLSQFELATRLAYLLWASGPDDALLDAAARGELASKAQVALKAREMLASPKARPAVSEFFQQWLGTNRLEVTSKSSESFPSYTPAAREAMARELPAFVEHVLWSSDRKFSTLLTAPVAFVSGPLAQVYGVNAPAGSTPQQVALPEQQARAGVLTQAGFAAVQAHPDQTSPVLRGKFVRTRLLCQAVPPPPPDIDITVPDVDEGGTARERFSAHLTAGNSCSGCHQLMDPIGLAFENFDAIGQHRESEHGQRIDVSGSINGSTDVALNGPFRGVRELAGKLAQSKQAQDCVATQWFRFAAGRTETTPDSCSLSTLQHLFSSSGGDLIELLVGITQTDAFWFRPPITQ